MVPNNPNPLMKHFRQPAIYLRLPSNGAYWPERSIDIPVTGELAVYPMTTRDEITLRTPDALLNGQGVVEVIKSCIPAIKDPWQMPNTDVDSALVAIRIASYGSDMEVGSKCPHCSNENNHTVDLSHILPRFRMPKFDSIVNIDGLKIKLKPAPYFSVNKNKQIMFEEQRLLQTVQDDEDDDLKTVRFNEHMKKLIDLNLESLAANTDYIETPEGIKVTDESFLKDFYLNASTKTVKLIREKLDELGKETNLPNIGVQCESCEQPYEMGIEFNYSSFFDQKS